MAPQTIYFTLFYIIFSLCFIYRSPVFISLGLTIEALFSRFLGNEAESFILYHLKRTTATVIVHGSLPLGRFYIDGCDWYINSYVWQGITFLFSTLAIFATIYALNWTKNNFQSHPVLIKLKKFSPDGNLPALIENCDAEFRTVNKLILNYSSTAYLIATQNWLIRVSPYTLDVAHQSDVVVEVISAVELEFAPEFPQGVQFLNILINPMRGLKSFSVRINSVNYKELRDFIKRPINVWENVQVQLTLQDRFLVLFKEQVAKNPPVVMEVEDMDCWGCSQARPNVKLRKTCSDSETEEEHLKCLMCFCAPIWCLDCIGVWFVSRQDKDRPDSWMSSKATCPLCRNTFCVLDVCPITNPS